MIEQSHPFSQRRRKSPDEREDEDNEIAEYVCLVGDEVAADMLLYRNDY